MEKNHDQHGTKQLRTILMIALVFLSLTFFLCACSSAVATNSAKNTFELRNGIHFGDTVDEIKEKETVLSLKKYNEEKKYLYYSGEIAGVDGSAYFYFDENDKLNEVMYSIYEVFDYESFEAAYNTIYSSCVRQYGNPLTGSDYPIRGTATNDTYDDLAEVRNNKGSTKIYEHNQWVVTGDNGKNTKIDLLYYSYADYAPALQTTTLPILCLKIDYYPFDQEVINDIDSAF